MGPVRKILILFLLPALTAGALDEFRLEKGTRIRGNLEVRENGIFRETAHGGEFYEWDEIAPDSLPAKIRNIPRQRILTALRRAHRLYSQGRVPAAQGYYKKVSESINYLSDADRQRPEMEDLALKVAGYVKHQGKYIRFADYQRARGLIRYNGKWIPKKQIEAQHAYRRALQNSYLAKTPEAALKLLRNVMQQYPGHKQREQAAERVLEIQKTVIGPDQPEPEVAPAKQAPPKIDDYYSAAYPGNLANALAAETPDFPELVYPKGNAGSGYPYFKDEDRTGYYIPKHTRDAQGFYHYTIDGVKFKSKRPPPKVHLKK